ncbi:hypothetical protein FO519_008178 [Halicephalobus sp. NKZ332]|nr:hypothetical protein FO519_008178 [Halicephalobus sp. NKZ332]
MDRMQRVQAASRARKIFLDQLHCLAFAGKFDFDVRDEVHDALAATVEYGRLRNLALQDNPDQDINEEDKQEFVTSFPPGVAALAGYARDMFFQHPYDEQEKGRIYRSAVEFLSNDILDVYKYCSGKEEISEDMKQQLEEIKKEVDPIMPSRPCPGHDPCPEGIPKNHYWCAVYSFHFNFHRFYSLTFCEEFNLSVKDKIHDALVEIFEYRRLRNLALEDNVDQDMNKEDKQEYIIKFSLGLTALEKHARYMFFQFPQDEREKGRTYWSAIQFLADNILDVYEYPTGKEDTEYMIDQVRGSEMK